jgi:cysteinyl-tRNA synthetase
MSLRLYNTKTRRKETFVPSRPGWARIYVCGPTVYDHCHIGHARTYLTFDLLHRFLEHQGYRVTFVENFTDVEDSILQRAREVGEDPLEMAEKFIEAYLRDSDALGIQRADHYPRVSEHVGEMIRLIQEFVERDLAYVVGGNVYFQVPEKGAYGRLIHQPLEEVLVEEENEKEVNPEKRNSQDFLLWQAVEREELSWESPWGPGRPGWHIECFFLARKYLGEVDLHGGGLDLIFPHHESEILLSEAYQGKDFSRYYLHNHLVTLKEEKMSKSRGNYITIRELLRKHRAEALRCFFFGVHYREPIEYSEEGIEEAERRLSTLVEFLDRLRCEVEKRKKRGGEGRGGEETVEALRKEVFEALEDDLDTERVLEALESVGEECREGMGAWGAHALEGLIDTFQEVGSILGLFQEGGTGNLFPGAGGR